MGVCLVKIVGGVPVKFHKVLKKLTHKETKKLAVIAVIITVAHAVEDIALVAIGRFTTVEIWMLAIGTISFSIFIGLIARIPSVKKFISS